MFSAKDCCEFMRGPLILSLCSVIVILLAPVANASPPSVLKACSGNGDCYGFVTASNEGISFGPDPESPPPKFEDWNGQPVCSQ